MGNIDILNEDDFFSTLKKEFSKESEKKSDSPVPEESASESGLADELVELPELDMKRASDEWEQDIFEVAKRGKESGDFQEDVDRDLEIDHPTMRGEDQDISEQEKKKLDLVEFYNEKQEKVSYRPFWIAGIVVVIMIAGFIGIRYVLFSKPKTEMTEQKKTSDTKENQAVDSVSVKNQPVSTPRTAKTKYYMQLANTTSREIGSISELTRLAEQDVRVTSILIYDRETLFEVFSPNRDKLAKFNVNLKNKFQSKYKLVSSKERPGQNGGIINLYTIEMPEASGAESEALQPALSDMQGMKTWLSGIMQSSSLKVDALNPITSKNSDDFTVYELDTRATGSYKDCLKMLTNLAENRRNIKIHKLTLNSLDQKSFNPASYQIKMIIKVFV